MKNEHVVEGQRVHFHAANAKRTGTVKAVNASTADEPKGTVVVVGDIEPAIQASAEITLPAQDLHLVSDPPAKK
jgi:hypothetical protein